MKGIHHLGLAVSNLAATSAFFCDLLGWKLVKKVPEYPAHFVSNGSVMFTLWQTDENPVSFDRKTNVGLHHVAILMDSEQELLDLYQKFEASDLVSIEFKPEFLGDGPTKHMIVNEPSGVRIEFIWLPA